MVRERQSNIELLRIIAMLMVLIIHANCYFIGEFTHQDAVINPMATFVRVLIQHLALPCVDVFVIISGYFAIRPKIRSIAGLWFLLAFWGGVSIMVDGGGLLSCCSRILFPFAGWFIPAYLGLYLVSPILNQYAQNEDSIRYAKYLVAFFTVQMLFDIFIMHEGHGWAILGRSVFNHGYSILSFIPLYLLGRYLKLHRPSFARPSFTIWFSAYFVLFFVAAIVIFISLYLLPSQGLAGYISGRIMRCSINYASPICVLGSLFLFLAFESLSFCSKTINRLAASAFAVFCFHGMNFYSATVRSIYQNHSGISVIVFDLLFIILVYLIGVMLDQVRILIWSVLSKFVFARKEPVV